MAIKGWPCVVLAIFNFIIFMNSLQVKVKSAPESLERKQEAFDVWWQEQLRRKRRVAKTCATLGLTTRATRTPFLYDAAHRLLLCWHAKVSARKLNLNS